MAVNTASNAICMPMTTPKVMARLDTTIRATVADFWAMFAKFI